MAGGRAAATPPLVLASRSPQRRAILEQLGVSFEVVPADVAEETAGVPRKVAVDNACRKARAVAGTRPESRRVLGADTAVALAGRVYGKPRDEGQAREFLTVLSGSTHEVWGGIALVEPSGGPGAERVAAAVTRVTFRRLGSADLDWYMASGEWRERAGGYAIQGRGAALVERIEGDFWNVVGLPVAELVRLEPTLLGH